MSMIEVKLTEQNSQRADDLARQTGKTPETLVNEAFERFAETAPQADQDEHQKFLAWREALFRIEGMWADRDDLPDFDEVRRSMDRNLWAECLRWQTVGFLITPPRSALCFMSLCFSRSCSKAEIAQR
jgi:hypothetical protein